MFSLSTFFHKRAEFGPHAAGIGPEHAQFNQELKAEALRKILRISLAGAGTGAGIGLLAHWLGQKTVPTPEADNPDIDLPYPQLRGPLTPETHAAIAERNRPRHQKYGSVLNAAQMIATPIIGTGIGAAYGAARHKKDPLAGGLYGGVHGLGEGLMTGAGAIGGRHLTMNLTNRLGMTGAKEKLLQILGGLAGGIVGNRVGDVATTKLMDATAGPPPWEHRKKADWADATARTLLPTPANEPSPSIFSPRWFRGDSMHTMGSMPWVMPAIMGAGIGGLAGGHALVRHLLKKRQKAKMEAELAKAKQEYEEAMLGQYDPTKLHSLAKDKQAAVSKLDVVYAHMEKAGFNVNQMLGYGGGLYALYALLASGLTGVGTYRYLQGRSKSKMLQEALKQRALVRHMSSPPDVFLHPTPAHLRDGKIQEDEEADPLKTLPV